MRLNQYLQAGSFVNSCLIGANAYQVLSVEAEFRGSLVEEITDRIRQIPGHCYMRLTTSLDKSELWMIPFSMDQQKFSRFQNTMEFVQRYTLGKEHFFFPFDLVSENSQAAYVIRPINRQRYVPIRKSMPDSYAERWKLSESLFRRVLELKQMGLTSNGISREQLRVCTATNEVKLWLNETLSFVDGSEIPENVLHHKGFLSLPKYTEDCCKKAGIYINGTQRDVFSAAVAAFYLIMYTHPFVGSGFDGLLRDDYLTNYRYYPMYVMMGDSRNDLGNQMFGRVVTTQWKRTVPALKELFDQMFMSVTNPDKYWDSDAPYWDPECWLIALKQDALENDNEASHSDFHFVNEQYHQV